MTREQFLRCVLACFLLAIAFACENNSVRAERDAAAWEREKFQIDACVKAGGVPWYFGEHLSSCQLPCGAGQ